MCDVMLRPSLVINVKNENCVKSLILSVDDIVQELQYKDGNEVKSISGRVKDIIAIDTVGDKTTNNSANSTGTSVNCPYSNLWGNATATAGTAYRRIQDSDSTSVRTPFTETLSTSDPVHNDCAARDYYITAENASISYPSANPLNVDKEGIYPDMPHLVSKRVSVTTDKEVSIGDLMKTRYVPKYLVIDASREYVCNIVKIELSSIIDILVVDHDMCDFC